MHGHPASRQRVTRVMRWRESAHLCSLATDAIAKLRCQTLGMWAFGRNPRVACKDKETRLNVLLGLRAWRRVMGERRRAWASGKRDVVFPRGCYGLWKLHGALVEGGHVPARPPSDPPGRDAPT